MDLLASTLPMFVFAIYHSYIAIELLQLCPKLFGPMMTSPATQNSQNIWYQMRVPQPLHVLVTASLGTEKGTALQILQDKNCYIIHNVEYRQTVVIHNAIPTTLQSACQ